MRHLWDRYRNWLTLRCGYCGKRFKRTEVVFQVGDGAYHGGLCVSVAGLRAKKQQLLTAEQRGEEIDVAEEREFECYYGSYHWWREVVLDESPLQAAINAKKHVQRSTARCPTCMGDGAIIEIGVDFGVVKGDRENMVFFTEPCSDCDGTGHKRVKDPVPMELIG